ncbi:hypothetical protein [Pseudomonas sp. 5Ae-yellow]|uniref:hypothetical protein n=1 Tax=Pseudomonas sp. 5Ae-yellow TaxID=2759848 RepID=UPI0015F4DCEB|nr:hypothetical protein [Pseudomonas sp. 5Ae-yellow]MBA6421698.1 hypothetical protein [Pseudomonas sp. 5Ae-yellow]
MGRKARQHWYSLYKTISPRIDAYEGNASIYDVIREEAKNVEYDAKVVKRMLDAGAFLDRFVSQPVTSDDITCGYAHIEMLERLSKLDLSKARAQLEAVLSNQITLKKLAEDIALSSQGPGQAQFSARSKARHRVSEHRALSIKLAIQAGPPFFGSSTDEMILVHKFRSLGQFILLIDNDQQMAVIPRLGDSSLNEAKAADQLLKLAQSYERSFNRIWLVLPADSPMLMELVAQASEIDAFENWLFLATPSEDGSELVQYTNRRRFLDKQVHGDSDDAWEGISLVDGRPMRGNLEAKKN